MRSRVTTLVVLSALIAGVQVFAAAPAAAMDDNGTDACLPMPGFPGFGTDSDGFCDPLEKSGGGGDGGGAGGDGSSGGADGGASGGGSPDEEGGEVIVIVEDVPDPEVDEPPQDQCWARPWECGPDQRGPRDDPLSSMDGQEGRKPVGRGGAPRVPAKKPKKALTRSEECQLLEKRGHLLAPYEVRQKTAELQRLRRRDAVLYDRWLERRGPYTNEDAADDAEARRIWREIAAIERELDGAARGEDLGCSELLRPDFPPS